MKTTPQLQQRYERQFAKEAAHIANAAATVLAMLNAQAQKKVEDVRAA